MQQSVVQKQDTERCKGFGYTLSPPPIQQDLWTDWILELHKSHAHIDNKTLACDPAFILASLPPLTGTSGQESSSKEDEDSDLSHVHSMDSHAAFGSEGDVGSQWMRS
jgi:hypothetical protein